MSDAELQARFPPIAHPGSQVLFPGATGMEKALADTDAERIINIASVLGVMPGCNTRSSRRRTA